MRKKKKEDIKKICYIFFRYLLLLVLAFQNLYLFYLIFTPLTIYPVFFLLKLFFNVSLQGNFIVSSSFSIQLVEACIAGSAYYLLLLLNLTTPMQLKKRIKSIIFSFLAFLVVNILRIFFFTILLSKSFSLFNLTHLLTWYVLSGIIVFLIWVLTIKRFKIKEIPVYSDLKFLKNLNK